MKKSLIAIASTLTYFSFVPAVFAAETVNLCANASGPAATLCGITTLSGLFGPFISFIFVMAIIIDLFFLIWGGLKWLTSGGEEKSVAAAREHIVAAVVGLVIILLSYFIISLLGQFFGFNITNLELPTLKLT